MENLDGLDFSQIISLLAAFIVGFLPNFIEVKNENGLTKKGILLIILFVITVGLGIITTIYKSVEDKSNYIKALSSSDSTLSKASMNLDSSNKIISLMGMSLTDLRKVQNNTLNIQKKSDSIQKYSFILGQSVNAIQEKTKSIIGNLNSLNKEITAKTNELAITQQKQLFPLDSNITLSLSFGFKSKSTDSTLEDFYKYISHFSGEDNIIDFDFVYLKELEDFLQNSTITILFYDHKSKSMTGDKTERLPICVLSNKITLHAFPQSPDQRGEHDIFSVDAPPIPMGCFKMNYNQKTKIFFLSCANIPMKITSVNNRYLSILDYDSMAVHIELIAKRFLKGGPLFYKWDNTYINFKINFSDKKHSLPYKGEISTNKFPNLNVESIHFSD